MVYKEFNLLYNQINPAFVEERIESVLNLMPDDEFERYKDALATQKLEKPKSISTQYKKYLDELSTQQYHFNRAHVEVSFLRTLSKEQFIDNYKEFIKRGGSSRCSLVIHVLSTAEGGSGH